MNFSALNELGFSFLRPFLKICRWALKKMSWNCKNLGMKGSLSSNFRLRKLLSGGWRWRRKYLILWLIFVAIGLIGLLISLNNGLMRRKVEAPDLDEDNTNLLLEHFNVSKERIQVLSAENVVYQKQYELAIEKLEANGQCPVPDENTLTNLDIVVQQIPLPISHCASLATSSDHQFCEKVEFFWMDKARSGIILHERIICVISVGYFCVIRNRFKGGHLEISARMQPSISQKYAGGSFLALLSAGNYAGYVENLGEMTGRNKFSSKNCLNNLSYFNTCSSNKLRHPQELLGSGGKNFLLFLSQLE
nr:histidine kinase 2 [Ipomoea batatas]